MYYGEKNKVLKNLDEKTIVEQVYLIFKENWKTSSSYKKRRIDVMNSKTLKPLILEHPALKYVQVLYLLLDGNDYKLLTPSIAEEITKWEREGGMCLHLSVLMHKLTQKLTPDIAANLKFYQGYYQFKMKKEAMLFGLFPENHLGMHSWLTYDGAVIDVTAGQNKMVFDVDSFILGEIPKGYKLAGFNETKLIDDYAQMFAQEAGFENVEKWTEVHLREFFKVKETLGF